MTISTYAYLIGFYGGNWIGWAVVCMFILFLREIITKLRKRPHHVNWRGYLITVSCLAALGMSASLYVHGI